MTERYYDRIEKKWKTCTLLRWHPQRPGINPDLQHPLAKCFAWVVVIALAIVYNMMQAMFNPFTREYVPGSVRGSGDEAGYT